MLRMSIDKNKQSTLKKIVVVWGWTRDNDGLKGGVTTPTNREAALSTTQLTRITSALAQALSVDEVNQIGRDTGQSERLRTVTPHRLLLAIITSLASAKVESIADLLREFNHQNDVTVAYKAFYNRLARPSFSKFMSQMFARLVERLSLRTLTPEGQTALGEPVSNSAGLLPTRSACSLRPRRRTRSAPTWSAATCSRASCTAPASRFGSSSRCS